MISDIFVVEVEVLPEVIAIAPISETVDRTVGDNVGKFVCAMMWGAAVCV